MKTTQIILYLMIFIAFSCNNADQKEKSQSNKSTASTLEVVPVDQILDNPDAFIDQQVKVEGMVSHVCRHSGKRLHLISKSTNKMIRVEAAEGINQFERELEGSDIIVKGTFHRQIIDEDYLSKWENEGMEGEGVHLEHNSAEMEAKEEQIQNMRKQLQETGKDQLISLWIDGNHFEVK